jgi:S-adenosylmethionine decarboxylase
MSDAVGIVRWLDLLPGKVGMRVLMPAKIKRDEPPKCPEINAGISGFVMLAESHASVHTWPARRELQFDLYSCRPFDVELVTEDLVRAFGIGSFDVTVVERRKRL